MTGAQANWIRSHKPYTPVAHAPGGYAYTKRGILNADGEFTPTDPKRRAVITPNCIEVGILTQIKNLERR